MLETVSGRRCLAGGPLFNTCLRFPLFGNAFPGAGAEAAPDSPDTEVPGVALAGITGRKATVEPIVECSRNLHHPQSPPHPQHAEEGAARRAGGNQSAAAVPRRSRVIHARPLYVSVYLF